MGFLVPIIGWIAANAVPIATAATVVAAGTTAVVSASDASSSRKAMKSAARAADDKQKALAARAKQAEVDAQLEAEEKIRKRIGSQTQTTLTSPIGVTGQANIQKPTLLGVG